MNNRDLTNAQVELEFLNDVLLPNVTNFRKFFMQIPKMRRLMVDFKGYLTVSKLQCLSQF